MDKIIKLEMNTNKDIEISVNGIKKITIKKSWENPSKKVIT